MITVIPRLTAAHTARLKGNLTGWVKLHSVINKLPATDILLLIQMEVRGENRAHIISRLRGRYLTLRAREADDTVDDTIDRAKEG